MKDQIIKFLAYQGKVSVTCINTTQLVEKARKIHDLGPLATAAFGRCLTMTAMMGAEMKNKQDKLTIQIKGNGPIGMMVTSSDFFPRVKGYVGNPQVDLPLNEDGKLDVGGAVGHEGYLNVIKDIGLKEPYIGICPLTSGEIADDFAEYFVTSEQKQAAIALGVLVDKEGVRSSGGYFIQPLPDATEEEISRLEQSIFKAGAISKMLDKNMSLKEIAILITGDEDIEILEENIIPLYECDCSKPKMEKALLSIGKQELEKILEEDEKAELTCHFCQKSYLFTKKELEELVKQLDV